MISERCPKKVIYFYYQVYTSKQEISISKPYFKQDSRYNIRCLYVNHLVEYGHFKLEKIYKEQTTLLNRTIVFYSFYTPVYFNTNFQFLSKKTANMVIVYCVYFLYTSVKLLQ
jgi:hypothetical protein